MKGLSSSLAGKSGIDLQYVYNTGTNNGQIAQMNDVVSGEQTVYTYDSLRRLIQAQASVSLWGQSFGYDGWGNLVSKTPTAGHTGTSMSLSMDVTTNRVTMSGFAYDADGNTTSIPATPQNITFGYDTQNRTGVCNLYGLSGERLGTYSYSNTYGFTETRCCVIGQASITSTQLSRNIYFAGRLIQSNGVTVAADRQDSVRLDENGNRHE